MQEVGGVAKYYALVISDFNPVQAEEIYQKCTIDQLRVAMLAYGFYHSEEG